MLNSGKLHQMGRSLLAGFSGINNYPTVGLIDGEFGEALEEDGCHYSPIYEIEGYDLIDIINYLETK